MNEQQIANEVVRLSRAEGVAACALVEAESGMLWCAAGQADGMDAVWEAATDYWRVYARMQPTFDVLGPMHVAMAFHTQGLLALVPCRVDPEMLVVFLTRHQQVDWKALQGEVRAFGAALLARPR